MTNAVQIAAALFLVLLNGFFVAAEFSLARARMTRLDQLADSGRGGAVLARDRSILAAGYNGSIRGLEHCDDAGHMMEGGHCTRTIHAEANAIVQAARNGVRIDGAAIYVTASPCWNCFKMIANAGVQFGEVASVTRISPSSSSNSSIAVSITRARPV